MATSNYNLTSGVITITLTLEERELVSRALLANPLLISNQLQFALASIAQGFQVADLEAIKRKLNQAVKVDLDSIKVILKL